MRPKREYFLLENAAETLNCSVDDIIHQGALGKLGISILLSNWHIRCYEEIQGKVTEFKFHGWETPLHKRLAVKCLREFEASPISTEAVLAVERVYTDHYSDPIAKHAELWFFNSIREVWQYEIGWRKFILERPGFIYPTSELLMALVQAGKNMDAIYPKPIMLNECTMIVLANDLEGLKRTKTSNSTSIYKIKDDDFQQWRQESQNLEIENHNKKEIHNLLIKRNNQLWRQGFDDWWKQQSFIKGKRGRRPGK